MENMTNNGVTDNDNSSNDDVLRITETIRDLTRPVLASFVTGSMKEFLFNVRVCLILYSI